jgi:hypothetical protein
MQFRVRFYGDAHGNKPVLAFLEGLRKQNRFVHKIVVARIKKLEEGELHGPPLTALIDQQEVLFGQGLELILTHGYLKKQQNVDARELERARSYKKDWKQRYL